MMKYIYFFFQAVCWIRFGSRKTNKMEELQRVSEREEFVIRHLKRMVETRESDWDTLTSLCSASYECGTAAKWYVGHIYQIFEWIDFISCTYIRDKNLLGDGILAQLRKLSAIMECALMTVSGFTHLSRFEDNNSFTLSPGARCNYERPKFASVSMSISIGSRASEIFSRSKRCPRWRGLREFLFGG